MNGEWAGGDLRFRYDIDSLVHIVSAVRLPELEFFRTAVESEPDLVITVAALGRGLRSRTEIRNGGTRIAYREHLGRLSANFEIDMGHPIRLRVTHLLVASPHVLYTNIVEVLLRLLLVRRDRMLLHSACIGLRGRGVLLSAQTDTGKTSTVLRLLGGERGYFYSDDMTILGADGVAGRYPKPMTISAHTLRALDIRRLRRRQQAALAVQSRIHSREGRQFAKWLAEHNLPMMTINAVTQAIVPPPKYMVTDLVDCIIGLTTSVQHLYFIERGTRTGLRAVDTAEAVERLRANTEDAYGFPPYADIIPKLVVGGTGQREMLERECDVLERGLAHVPATVLTTPDFSWGSMIVQDLQGADMELVGREVPAVAVGLPDEPEEEASAVAAS